jgi:hypothetical protein
MKKSKAKIVRLIPYNNDIFDVTDNEEELENDPLKFPAEVMSGFAGEFARIYSDILEPPKHAFYMAAMTCLGSVLSGSVRVESELKTDPRMYTLLLGQSGTARKSTANSKATEFFTNTLEEFRVSWGVGSAEGLQESMTQNKWDIRLLLCFDEFRQFISKCKIDSSVLLPCVNTLFESNRYENSTKGKGVKLEDAHLSLLSASTIDTYEQCWDNAFTAIGFNNRLFIVPGTSVRKYALPPPIKKSDYNYLQDMLLTIAEATKMGIEYPIQPIARAFYEEWYRNIEASGHATRLDTYATRFMSLMTANDNKEYVDMATVVKATKLCDWQLKVRRQYDPIDADTRSAKMEEKIRRVLINKPYQSVRELKQMTNAPRVGLFIFNQALKNLRDAGDVLQDEKKKFYIPKVGN